MIEGRHVPEAATQWFLLSTATAPQNSAHGVTANTFSAKVGGKIRMKALPFTSAEKLDTQKGIRNSLKICQRSSFTLLAVPEVVLMNKPKPMIALKPRDVSHRRRLASKCRATITQYQKK